MGGVEIDGGIKMTSIGGEWDLLDLNGKPYKFNLTYDKHKRIAYLRSEPLALTQTAQYLVLVIGDAVRAAV